MLSKETHSGSYRKICLTCGKEFAEDILLCPDDDELLTPIKADNLIGTVLSGKYEILEKLGAGGMGLVYKAKHTLMKRLVAIKIMLPQLIASVSALKRFKQEAQAASSLNHPNILTVFDFGVTPDGMPYLVMDYLEGTNLTKLLETNQHLPLDVAVDIFIQTASGLAHAHRKGIVHRDLKPANIMLTEWEGKSNFVKVVDFGMAKILGAVDGESEELTKSGEIFGSPLYMSPEQCMGKVLDARSDIYSLGCVMYRVVTGVTAVNGQSAIECFSNHVSGVLRSFEEVAPGVSFPAGLEEVVFKAMAKEPENRYQSMDELKDALVEMVRTSMSGLYGTLSGSIYAQKETVSLHGISLTDAMAVVKEAEARAAASDSDSSVAGSDGHTVRVSPSEGKGSGSGSGSSTGVGTGDAGATAALPRPHLSGAPAFQTGPLPGSGVSAESIVAAASASSVPAVPTEVATQPKTPTEERQALPPPKSPQEFIGGKGDKGDKFDKGSKASALASTASRKYSSGKLPMPLLIGATFLALAAGGGSFYLLSRGNPAGDAGGTANVAVDGKAAFEELMKRGHAAFDHGDFKGALSQYEAALAKAKEKGRYEKQVPEAEIWINKSCYELGQFDKALEACRAVLKVRESAGQINAPDASEALNDMGTIYLAKGDFKEAKTYFDRALKIRQGYKGAEKDKVAETLAGLGNLDLSTGHPRDAVGHLSQALNIAEYSLAFDPVDKANIESALGQAYQLTGKLSKAKELYQKALELREKSLSPDNPAIADSLLILGTLEFKSRNLDKAESLFNRAMDINTRNGSAGKDGLSDAQFCLAMVCDAKKDKARALSLAKSSYELRQQSFGEEDQRTVEAKSLMQRLSK